MILDNIVLPDTLLLPEVCELTRIQRELKRNFPPYGTGLNIRRKDSYQQMTFGNHIATINATYPKLYEVIAETQKAQNDTLRKPVFTQAPLPTFIEAVRVGSHDEYIKWDTDKQQYETLPKYKVGYHHRVVTDYKTVYHDCLCDKDWLKEHEHDVMPEPTIDISVDGGKSVSLNGNFKKGMIQGFMSEYTERVRAGKNVMTISKEPVAKLPTQFETTRKCLNAS